jgi:4-amino-4-deoxy-L-arabinose transferase-like glycosyltransferase
MPSDIPGGLTHGAGNAPLPAWTAVRAGVGVDVRAHAVRWVVGAFIAVQAGILAVAPSGPFVDEGLYVVAGQRVLEGHGLSDGYLAWFNGSPFVWPVLAALGHRVAGLEGARLVAIFLSAVALLAIAAAAARLFGARAAVWCVGVLALNGLFAALAHFAVYDVAALTCLAISIWCVSRSTGSDARGWIVAAAAVLALSVVAKYGYVAMVLPVVGLLVSTRGVRAGARSALLFMAVFAGIVGAYFLASFGTLVPPSSGAYLEQSFSRTRGHIATLQVVFGAVPLALALAALPGVRRRAGGWARAAVCVLALFVYPAFHLWTGNFVSGQKHVVAGFLFASMLAGVTLDRLWSRSRPATLAVLMPLAVWGGLQCAWQDRSWADARPLADHLATHVRLGERVLAESAWVYTMYLYPAGRVASPAAVIDANHSPERLSVDPCRVPWIVGNPESAPHLRDALARCGHAPVLTIRTPQYYFDTSRLALTESTVEVGLYRLPSRD